MGRYSHKQQVIILAGTNRQKTRKAGMRHEDTVVTTVLE